MDIVHAVTHQEFRAAYTAAISNDTKEFAPFTSIEEVQKLISCS